MEQTWVEFVLTNNDSKQKEEIMTQKRKRTVFDTAADKALKDLKANNEKQMNHERSIRNLKTKAAHLIQGIKALEPLIGRTLLPATKQNPNLPKTNTNAITQIISRKGANSPATIAKEATRLGLFSNDLSDSQIYAKTLSILQQQLREGNLRKTEAGLYDLYDRKLQHKYGV